MSDVCESAGAAGAFGAAPVSMSDEDGAACGSGPMAICASGPCEGEGAHAAKILVLNGPNLNMLGVREPEVYGETTLPQIEQELKAYGAELGLCVECAQSNHEGALIDALQAAHVDYDGVVFNPGAYGHYSYALRDAIAAIAVPVVEVHLTDVFARAASDPAQAFRATLVLSGVCAATFMGGGVQSYRDALRYLAETVE